MAEIPTTEEFAAILDEKIAPLYALIQSLSPKTQNNQDEIGGVALAAEITGKAVPTIYSLVATRQIPHFKRGKQLYFSKKDLLDWIQSGRRRTVAEIQTQI